MNDNAKTYTKPQLDRFGTLAELSASGSGMQAEQSMTGNMDGMGGGMASRRA